jgi:membrane fusion protein, multidrug efflux system
VGETVDDTRVDDRRVEAPATRPQPSRADTKPDRMDRADPGTGRSEPTRDQAEHEADGDKRRSRWPIVVLGLIVVLTIVGSVVYWWTTRGYETTDDAYTDGHSVVIAPKVAGYVTELDVNDNTVVKAGQLLFKIDPRDYVTARDQARANLSLARSQLAGAEVNLQVTRVRAPAQLAQAQAQLAQARATQDQAEQNYRRQRAVDPRATTQTNIDQATAQLKTETASVSSAQANVQIADLVQQSVQTALDQVQQGQAQVAQAEASLAQAEVNLSYTEIHAPQDGRVTKRNIDLGTYVQAGQQSFYIVTPQAWVTANFKEGQLADMHPGQPVSIGVDAYPQLKLQGHIDSIQQGSGAQFSAFPPENATGNYVKIVRRVPVKIDIDSGMPDGQTLPLGLSAEASVDERGAAKH